MIPAILVEQNIHALPAAGHRILPATVLAHVLEMPLERQSLPPRFESLTVKQIGPIASPRALRPSFDLSVVLPDSSAEILRRPHVGPSCSAFDAVHERAHCETVYYGGEKKKVGVAGTGILYRC